MLKHKWFIEEYRDINMATLLRELDAFIKRMCTSSHGYFQGSEPRRCPDRAFHAKIALRAVKDLTRA